jgi:hexosaminidase
MYSNPAGKDLAIQFNLIENVYEGLEQFKAAIVLTNNSAAPLSGNWSIYFNFLRMIFPESVSEGFHIQHINGDFFCLTPTPAFQPVAPNTPITIGFVAKYWAIKSIDAPVGFYIIYNDNDGNPLAPEAIKNFSIGAFSRPAQLIRHTGDHLPVPTALSRFEQDNNLHLLPKDDLSPISPKPVFLKKGTGVFKILPSHRIAHTPALKAEAQYLSNLLAESLGTPLVIVEGNIGEIRLGMGDVEMDGNLEKRASAAYHLEVHTNGIDIIATDATSVFYGIQSLRMLLGSNQESDTTAVSVAFIEIRDAAGFAYRGLHLDVGRNFHSIESIRKVLDMMALYKLNKFHFHLTDDEGWRIEIADLPELTQIGGRRGHTMTEKDCLLPSYGSGSDPNDPSSSGNGFYSRQQLIELLQYAHQLHIEVIPAIDFPGHARAAIRAMEARYHHYISLGDTAAAHAYLLTDWEDASVYESVQMWRKNVVNIGMESTYAFIEKVVDELISMYAEAGVALPMVHIGGDEVPEGVWMQSPACQQLMSLHPKLKDAQDLSDYFLRRVNQILSSRGILTAGWEEIAMTHKGGKRMPNPTFSGEQMVPYIWNTIWGGGEEEVAYALANSGYKVVLSNAPNLYFDFAYDKDPEEPGYYWGGYLNTENTFKFQPFDLYQCAEQDVLGNSIDAALKYKNAIRLTEKGRNNILGIQGQLWSETIRSAERIEYLLFPRMIALAERAWGNEPNWANEKDPVLRQDAYTAAWNEFANRLGQIELPRLDAMFGGIRYRIPLPGAKVENGVLKANVEFPGLDIRYTTDGTEPTVHSALYAEPVAVAETKVFLLKTFDRNGRSSRLATVEVTMPTAPTI